MSAILSYSNSFDAIMLTIAVAVNLLLAFFVYASGSKSATNRIFSYLALITSLWLLVTYVARLPGIFESSLIIHRLGIFFAAPMSLFFFLLAHTFPSTQIQLSRRTLWSAIAATFGMMAFNMSPYAFVGIHTIEGGSQPVAGPGIMPFSIISTIFSFLAVYLLVRKYRSESGAAQKQVSFILAGICIMLALIIATILIPILAFNSAIFLPFAPLYALVFLSFTAYAITKYQLFNGKVLLTQALTTVLWIVLFGKLVGGGSGTARIVDGVVLVFTLIFGSLLIRSVKREVAQRELIEKQEKELEFANKQQETLLHFISHEIKGYLSDGQNAFAALVEGDLGELPAKSKEFTKVALARMRRGVTTVMDILDAANLKNGTMAFNKEPFDFLAELRLVIDEMAPRFVKHKLQFTFDPPREGNYVVNGDVRKISHHVMRNLIDNAIKYTPSGSITVSLTVAGSAIRFSVRDTGVGITKEDMQRLFTEGGHGKDSIKVNALSTGYGLFIAKQVVEAHGGTIWAKSAGAGKGSEFVVELPIGK